MDCSPAVPTNTIATTSTTTRPGRHASVTHLIAAAPDDVAALAAACRGCCGAGVVGQLGSRGGSACESAFQVRRQQVLHLQALALLGSAWRVCECVSE